VQLRWRGSIPLICCEPEGDKKDGNHKNGHSAEDAECANVSIGNHVATVLIPT